MFICVHISLLYSLVYILISICLGVSLCQSDIEVRHAHYTISRANRTHEKSTLYSNNLDYGSVARNINCTLRTPNNLLTMNQSFVSRKPLFTFAKIQCKFTCFIYITSAGNFIKLLITINPLIAFFLSIISDHALKSKHIYNNYIGGCGDQLMVLIRRSTFYNILYSVVGKRTRLGNFEHAG